MEDKEKNLPKEPVEDAPGIEGADERAPDAAGSSELSLELEETKKRMAYLAAEFDNFRKRVTREKESLITYGNERLLKAILPFLDNLERAMSQDTASISPEGLLSGVRLTYEQLLSELRKFGLERIPAEGDFDPAVHEAIAQTECEEKPEGTIVAEARRGYTLWGRLLRPAQVIVAKAKEPSSPSKSGGPDRIIPVED